MSVFISIFRKSVVVKLHMVQLFNCVYPTIEKEAQQSGAEVLLWLQAEEPGADLEVGFRGLQPPQSPGYPP